MMPNDVTVIWRWTNIAFQSSKSQTLGCSVNGGVNIGISSESSHTFIAHIPSRSVVCVSPGPSISLATMV